MDQQNKDFPDFICICELCDCGKHRQHRGCKKLNGKVKIGWGFDNRMVSDYISTFTWPQEKRWSTRSPRLTPVKPTLPHLSTSGIQCCISSQLKPLTKCLAVPAMEGHDITVNGHSTTEKPAPQKHPIRPEKDSYLDLDKTLHSNSCPRLGELPAVVDHFPKRRSPARPHLDNLGINPTLKNDFRTVQMETYPGWNISRNHRPDPIRLKEELTVQNQAPFHNDTITKMDFQVHSLASARRLPFQERRSNLELLQGPFIGQTSNMTFFKDWGVKKRVRHGELYYAACESPTVKFESNTTNSLTFVEKRTERVSNCKPEYKVVVEGEQDFGTVYREAYRPYTIPMCRLQRYLAQHLSRPGIEVDGKQGDWL